MRRLRPFFWFTGITPICFSPSRHLWFLTVSVPLVVLFFPDFEIPFLWPARAVFTD